MPRRFSNCFACLTVLMATSNASSARDYAIAVADQLPRETVEAVHAGIVDFVMNGAARGDTIRLFDASNARQITEFEIPDSGQADVESLRRRAISPAMREWVQFAQRHYADAPAGQEIGDINLPALTDFLSTVAYADQPPSDRTLCMLVIGNANLNDPREADFAMIDGRFPADGLIAQARSQSPFGTLDRQGFLEGIGITLLSTDTDWQNDLHRLRVERTWYLFLRAQGGTLVTFTDDFDQAFRRFSQCETRPGQDFDWDSTREINAMIDAQRVTETIQESAVETAQPASDQITGLGNDDWLERAEVDASSVAPSVRTASLEVGIRWGEGGVCADSDVDLWFRSSPEREYLYYNNTETADGTYEKDYRSEPGIRNGLEMVTVTDQVDLENLEIWINYYAGTCPGGIHGQVRAFVNGSVFELPFAISADRGNRGRDMGGGSEHWVQIDPRELFNLD